MSTIPQNNPLKQEPNILLRWPETTEKNRESKDSSNQHHQATEKIVNVELITPTME
jgi:hypothetical protein